MADQNNEDLHQRPRFPGAIPIHGAAEQEEAERRVRDDAYKLRDDQYKQRQETINSQQLKTNRWMMLLTGGLVLCGLLGNAVSCYQARISAAAAVAAQTAADAAKDANRLAQDLRADNNKAAADSLLQMQAQTTAAQNSAGASQSAAGTARRSLDASLQSFRLDSRAWVELDPIQPKIDLRITKDQAVYKYDIYARNIGKTIAREVSMLAFSTGSGLEFGSDAAALDRSQRN